MRTTAAVAVGVLTLVGGAATAAPAEAPTFPKGYEAAYRAYLAALPPAARKLSWVTRLDGPSRPATPMTVGGKPVVYLFGCKDHACDTDNVNIFLAPDRTQVRAVLRLDGAQSLLGGAGPQEVACVKRIDASGGTATAC